MPRLAEGVNPETLRALRASANARIVIGALIVIDGQVLRGANVILQHRLILELYFVRRCAPDLDKWDDHTVAITDDCCATWRSQPNISTAKRFGRVVFVAGQFVETILLICEMSKGPER